MAHGLLGLDAVYIHIYIYIDIDIKIYGYINVYRHRAIDSHIHIDRQIDICMKQCDLNM